MTKWSGHTPKLTVFSLETGSPAGSGCWLSAPLQQCNTPHSSSPAGSLWAAQASPDEKKHVKLCKGFHSVSTGFGGHWSCSPVCWEQFGSHWWAVSTMMKCWSTAILKSNLCMSQVWDYLIYLHQRKPQLRWDTQGLEVFVSNMVKTVQNQDTSTEDLTGPAQTYKTKASK